MTCFARLCSPTRSWFEDASPTLVRALCILLIINVHDGRDDSLTPSIPRNTPPTLQTCSTISRKSSSSTMTNKLYGESIHEFQLGSFARSRNLFRRASEAQKQINVMQGLGLWPRLTGLFSEPPLFRKNALRSQVQFSWLSGFGLAGWDSTIFGPAKGSLDRTSMFLQR